MKYRYNHAGVSPFEVGSIYTLDEIKRVLGDRARDEVIKEMFEIVTEKTQEDVNINRPVKRAKR